MRHFVRICLSILLTGGGCIGLLLFTTCDTPLSLGTKVNTEKPVISVPGETVSKPGDYLHGDDNSVSFEVKQKFGISEVYLTLYWTDEKGEEQTRAVPATLDPETGLYKSNIDTTGIPDGQIRAQVTAVDVSGNKSTTTDMIYTIKNMPPQLELTIPAVKGGTMSNTGYPVGSLPDFDDPDLAGLLKNDPVYMGFELMGFAEDNLGIELGYPKIKIWPVPKDVRDYADYGLDANGNPTEGSEHDKWYSVKKPNDISGLKATKFSYDISKVASNMPGDYRLILVTKDLFGRENYYPNRTDNRYGEDPFAEDYTGPKYIQINYMAADIPIVMIEDITPMYYNGIGELNVTMIISSQNELDTVKAYITDSREYDPDVDREYNANIDLSSTNPYSAKLTIQTVDAAGWEESTTSSGNKYVHIVATDNQRKKSPAISQAFTFDKTPPVVEFERPDPISKERKSGKLTQTGGGYVIFDVWNGGNYEPNWFTGQITVGGTSLDSMSGLKKVYYHIGYLGDDDLTGDALETKYKNTDWKDTLIDTLSPEPGWSGYLHSWSYTDNFNEYGMANKDKIQTSGELGLTGDGLVTPDKDKMDKDSKFYLPFYVKVTDGADNYMIAQYKLRIDPNMDIPLVTISYPAGSIPKTDTTEEKKSMVGGEVRLSGIATDNNKVHSVHIRVKDNDTNLWYIPEGAVPSNLAQYKLPDKEPVRYAVESMAADTTGWFKANKIGDDMTVSWYYNLNSDGKLNPTGTDTEKKVTIEVFAVDTKGQIYEDKPDLVGPAESIIVYFSNDVPQITNLKIAKDNVDTKDYIEGVTTAGTFNISLTITDAEGIINANASLNNVNVILMQGGNKQSLPTGWSLSEPVLVDGRQQYTLNINDINSVSDFPYGSTGSLSLNVKAENYRENGNLSTERPYTIGIDNFFPNAVIETQTNASGKAFEIKGSAKDYGDGSGSIQGLERMLVYFEKAIIKYNGSTRTVEGTGEYLNPRNFSIPASGTGTGDSFYSKTVYTSQSINWGTSMPAMESYSYLRDGEGASGPNLSNTIKFPLLRPITKGTGVNASVVWESPHAMVIDKQELGADEDLDEDGTFGEIWNGVADKTWQARMDTTAFPDGPLMVHYIIMDEAGNATHYQEDIFIENNKPRIEFINLGTDIKGDGNVSDWVDDDENHGEFLREPVTIGTTTSGSGKNVIDPPFRVRNDRFRIMLEATGGNGTKHAKASYVTAVPHDGTTPANTIPVTEMKRGRVYTIAYAGATDWQQYGAPNSNINTTFVASGPGKGSGRVTEYTEVKSATGVLVSNGTNPYYNILFDDSHFGLATDGLIPDSEKDGIGDVTAANANARLFIIKVYDETVSGEGIQEEDQLAHAVLVGLDIDNDDSKRPEITINPFYWTSESDNSLYEKSKKNGHIELDAVPKISGQVSFRGTASDNTGIGRIYFVIDGHDGGYSGAANTTIGGKTYYLAASFSGGVWTETEQYASAGWRFKIETETHDQSGHRINWRLDYDSSRITGMAKTGNTLTVIAQDTSENTSGSKDYPFDVVPYISEVITNLSSAYGSNPSAFNRSALGWYPVREDEIIQIKGFNLTEAAVYVDPPAGTGTVHPLTTSPTSAQLTSAGITTTVDSNTHKNIIVDSSTDSGFLRVQVNSIDSINNTNSNNESYNKEPNGVNNNNLNDDRKLYVWNTGYLVNETNILNPFMRVSNDSTRFITFGIWTGNGTAANAGQLKVIRDNTGLGTTGIPLDGITATQGTISNQTNRFLNTTIAVTKGNEWAVAASNMTASQSNFNFIYNAFATGTGNSNGGSNRRYLLNLGTDPYSIRFPRVAVQRGGNANNTQPATANPARMALSYYHGRNSVNPIIIHLGLHTGYTATNGTITAGNFIGTTGNNFTNTGPANPPTDATMVVADNTSTKAKSGMYTAVGLLSNGRPVLAWYDSNSAPQCLWFSYGNVPSTTNVNAASTTDWQNNAVKIGDWVGTHVDLAVDDDDNVHLAYVDVRNGGLYYTYIPASNGGTANAVPNSQPNSGTNIIPNGAVTTVSVDTFLSVGTKLMLNVRSGVPYITYIHNAFNETKNSVRVAWQKNPVLQNGTNSDDTFTGAWEVMTVPAGTIPLTDEFVCNGVPASGNLAAPSGASTLRAYTGMNTSILVSYMTQSWYEGAVLKYDIANSLGQ